MSGERASFSDGPGLFFERVFRLAELTADPSLSQYPRGTDEPDTVRDDRERLAKVAVRELEQRAERARFLPEEIFSDTGWLILLDLFVYDSHGQTIPLSDSAHRWGIAQETALRQIAGLIAHGLVRRVAGSGDSGAASLTLTQHGLDALCETLKRLE